MRSGESSEESGGGQGGCDTIPGVVAGKQFEEVLEIEDRFEVERLVEVMFEKELDVGKGVKLDEVVEVREGVEVG